MSVTEATSNTTPRLSNSSTARNVRLFLGRGIIAIAWAAVFAAVSHSLTTAVTVGAGVLLVLYPLIDVAASLIDARSQHGSARQLLLGGAAVSAVAAVGLGVAATGSVSDVLAVFGVWAAISGAAQLVLALRRRAQLGRQWPMRIAGGFSVIAGISYIIASTAHQPRLMVLVIYTATGGVEFVVQAWLLAAARSPPKHTRRPRPERELKRRARRASCRIPWPARSSTPRRGACVPGRAVTHRPGLESTPGYSRARHAHAVGDPQDHDQIH